MAKIQGLYAYMVVGLVSTTSSYLVGQHTITFKNETDEAVRIVPTCSQGIACDQSHVIDPLHEKNIETSSPIEFVMITTPTYATPGQIRRELNRAAREHRPTSHRIRGARTSEETDNNRTIYSSDGYKYRDDALKLVDESGNDLVSINASMGDISEEEKLDPHYKHRITLPLSGNTKALLIIKKQ